MMDTNGMPAFTMNLMNVRRRPWKVVSVAHPAMKHAAYATARIMLTPSGENFSLQTHKTDTMLALLLIMLSVKVHVHVQVCSG